MVVWVMFLHMSTYMFMNPDTLSSVLERTKDCPLRVPWHVFLTILQSLRVCCSLLQRKFLLWSQGPGYLWEKAETSLWSLIEPLTTSLPARSQPSAEEWNGTHTLGLCPRRGGDEASEDFRGEGKSQKKEKASGHSLLHLIFHSLNYVWLHTKPLLLRDYCLFKYKSSPQFHQE